MQRVSFALAAFAGLGVSGSALAGIATWTGQLQLVGDTENPVSFEYDQMASNEHMALYVETVGHTLDSDLMADIPGAAGTYTRFNRPAQPFAIEAGTFIDSYFIHQDLVGNNPNFGMLMNFSITFEQPILGLIVGGDWADATLFRTTLDDSDFLGANATYTTNSDLRRRGSLEGSVAEFLTISPDGYTLTGAMHSTGVHVDNVRIITQGSIIPTPGATALLGLAGVVMYRRRRA
jgi:hypothetical protein